MPVGGMARVTSHRPKSWQSSPRPQLKNCGLTFPLCSFGRAARADENRRDAPAARYSLWRRSAIRRSILWRSPMRRRLSRTPGRKSLRAQAGLSMLLMLGVVDRRGNLVIRAEPPGWGKVGLNPYRTVETNPGLAFAALTPPTTGRAVRPGHFRFRSRAVAIVPGTHAAVRPMAYRGHERTSRRWRARP
jgi:hypothetical protein